MGRVNGGAEVPTLTVGGRKLTDLANLIVLTGRFSTGANRYYGMPKANGSGAYQVTAHKTLRIIAARVVVGVAAAGAGLNLGYSDAAVTVSGTSGAPTNAVLMGGSAAVWFAGVSSLGSLEYPLNFTVPATKYVHIDQAGNTVDGLVHLFCYEE